MSLYRGESARRGVMLTMDSLGSPEDRTRCGALKMDAFGTSSASLKLRTAFSLWFLRATLGSGVTPQNSSIRNKEWSPANRAGVLG